MKETGSGTVTVDKVLNPGTADEVKTRVGDADVRISAYGISGTVIVEGALYDFRIQAGNTCSVIQVNRLYNERYEHLIDFSHMSGYRGTGTIRLETSLISDLRGLLFKIDYGNNAFEAEITTGTTPVFYLNSRLAYRGRQIKGAEFEFYNVFILQFYNASACHDEN